MAAPSNYRKANDKPTFYYNQKAKRKARGTEDSLPKEPGKKKKMTVEEFKQKYGKVVWCDFYKCIYNETPKGASRKLGTVLENPHYEPLGPKDEGWIGICGTRKPEIAIRFKEVTSPGGVKQKVPQCFNGTSNQTGRVDMSRFLQGNGTPHGGSIESQSADQGFTNVAFDIGR
jgi:hypothetical protein